MSLLEIIPGQRPSRTERTATVVRGVLKRSRSKRVVRNHGMSAFAREQGVHVTHAYRVIMGDRVSHRLYAAWEAFNKAKQPAA